MFDRPAGVRSYQRIFKPDRRIYTVDGRTLPIPGGVPLRWLAQFAAALVAVIALVAGSHLLILAAAVGTGGAAARLDRRRLIVPVAAVTVAGCVVSGLLLALLDWPLRLVVLPALVATVATQATRDGRPAHRYALSWLRARIAGRRLLLDALPDQGRPPQHARAVRLRVASDRHSPCLHRARLTGPGVVRFTTPVALGAQRGRRTVRPLSSRQARQSLMVDELVLGDGESIRVRP